MRTLLALAMVGCSTVPQVVAVPMPGSETTRAPAYVVTGTATIEAIPDRAELVVALSAERALPKDAASAVKASQVALGEALTSAGVKTTDLAVSQLQLAPIYELVDPRGAKTRLRGYEAQLTVTVTTRDFEVLPDLMERAAGAGATHLSSRFVVEDLPAIRQRARDDAAKAARRKAEAMAETLGVELGRVRTITEMGSAGLDNNFLANEYQPAEPIGLQGEAQEVTVTVSVGYDLG